MERTLIHDLKAGPGGTRGMAECWKRLFGGFVAMRVRQSVRHVSGRKSLGAPVGC